MYGHNSHNALHSNPMLKGYVSSQERVQMRERERMARGQIAQQASRDSFLEATSGAVFAEPIKVKRHNSQITAILGEFDRVAPIMRSEREHSSLVGADVMPCTPAPVLQDHDHLHSWSPPASPRAPLPPPPPRLAPPPPPPPPPPQLAGGSGGGRHPRAAGALPPPPAPSLPPLLTTTAFHQSSRSSKQQGRSDKRDRPEVMSILQEMTSVPVSALVTPLKVNPQPFQYPSSASKDASSASAVRTTPDRLAAPRDAPPPREQHRDHAPASRESHRDPAAARDALRDPAAAREQHREPAAAREGRRAPLLPTPPAPGRPHGAGGLLPTPRSNPPLAALSKPRSLSDDLSISEDSDEERPAKPSGGAEHQRPAGRRPSVHGKSSEHRTSHAGRGASTTVSPAATAKKSGFSSGSSSESESDSESDESADERTRGASVGRGPADSTPAAGTANTPNDAKEDGSSPSGGGSTNKWSLRSIMSKDPGGTPVSSIFDDSARSVHKLSPHDFPSSLDPVDPVSSLEPVDPSSLDPVDPSSAEPVDPNVHDDMSIEELVSQVQVPTSALLSDIGDDGSVPMDISITSEDEAPEPPPPPAPPPPPDAAASSSVRSSIGGKRPRPPPPDAAASCSARSSIGGKRPRPRLSALSNSDSEKLERSRRHQIPSQEAQSRRPGRPRVKQKEAPEPAGSDSDSDSDVEIPKTEKAVPSRTLLSKGAVKGETGTGTVPKPAARGPGRPRKEVPLPPVGYKSRDVLSTATESSDDEQKSVPSKRRRCSKQQPSPSVSPPKPEREISSSSEDEKPAVPSNRSDSGAANTVGPGYVSTDSDSPPKLDMDVSTSDANKKATFSRLFSHRIPGKRGTPRGRVAASSERSDGQASPAVAAGQPPVLVPEVAPPAATVAPPELTLVTPAVPLPPLSRQNGVPVLRCRIEKRLVATPKCDRQDAESAATKEVPSEPRSRGEDEVTRDAAMQSKRRDAERRGHRHARNRSDLPAPAAAGRPGSAQAHCSSSQASGDAGASDVSATPTKRPPRDTTVDERANRTASTQSNPVDTRIESPPTGVREADSSTNPTSAQIPYDANVPHALLTSQPFPIPAGDQNQYLKQARRLKWAADNEADMTLKVIRYTQAVLYFLLTALSMEKEEDETEAMLAMLNDTLKLIKDMLRLSHATYRKQGRRPTPIDLKLQTLLLRCQGLIYLRMFQLKETDHKKAQRQITDFKTQMLQDSLTADGRSYVVPRELFRLMLKCNETQSHLREWLDYWEQANEMMQQSPDIVEFFADIDRTMGSLLATSTLLDLVYYIRETTKRLQEMHREGGV